VRRWRRNLGLCVRVGNTTFVPFSVRKTGWFVDKCSIFRPLFAGFSLWRPGIDALADPRDWGWTSITVIGFSQNTYPLPPRISYHYQCSIFMLSVAHYSSTIRLYNPDADCRTEWTAEKLSLVLPIVVYIINMSLTEIMACVHRMLLCHNGSIRCRC